MAVSAGLLMYRQTPDGVEVLLVHPGGPFFRNKDEGSWSVPKGLVDDGEEGLDAARREFEEETGFPVTAEEFVELGEVQQKSGKRVRAWAFEGDCDPSNIESNTFELEWPPRSGKMRTFPEVDRAEFFGLGEASSKINPRQVEFLEKLAEEVSRPRDP